MIVDITMTPNMFIVILLVALAPLTGLYGWYFPKYHHQHLFRLGSGASVAPDLSEPTARHFLNKNIKVNTSSSSTLLVLLEFSWMKLLLRTLPLRARLYQMVL